MAIIYSYPINTNILATDIIVGSSTVLVGGRPKNQTKSFEIQDLAAYFSSVILPPGGLVPYTGATQSVDLGAYNLTATSIIKAGGTNVQYLMADGSVTTGSTVPTAALTKTNDTNVTLTLGGSPATALLAATSLTLGWSGTLADSRITSAAIWNAKQGAITLTTTGTGAATFVANVLNIPTPSGTPSPLTTKGDLYTFSTVNTRLPVGLDTQVLLADSSTSTGLKWGTNTAATPLGYYGAFSDVTDQFATVINTGYPMLLGITDLSNGITVVSNSRVTIANTGIYNIQWSAQFRNPTANEHDVTIWLRKNGVDVPGSAGVVLVPKKHGSFDGHNLPSWNFLLDAVAGDYYEFVWSTQNLAVFISFEPAAGSTPSTASVVMTVTQQSGIMAGTGMTSLTTTGTSGPATYNSGIGLLNIPNYTLGLTGYVPYTGATQAVNLGAFDLTLNGATMGRGGGQVYSNIVFGLSSLSNNTTGQNNTYVGFSSGYYNTIGSYNSAIGCFASQFNTTGNYNISIGDAALYANTTGSNNIAVGPGALVSNTVGGSNTAIGKGALSFNTVGLQNIAIGNDAGKSLTISGNNTSGNQNIFIGESTTSLTNADANQIVIGYNAAGAGSNTVVIGNSSITTTRLRGAVQGGSFVKDLGTAAEYLMADGSVTTSGPLFKAASSATATGVISVISPAIIGSLFPDGSILRIQTMVTFGPSQTLNITPIRYYINTSPSLVGATQIAIFNIVAGIRYSGVERSFWSIANTFNARNFTDSSQSSITNSTNSPGSTSIPATFYIIASMSVGVGDLGTIASILVEKI